MHQQSPGTPRHMTSGFNARPEFAVQGWCQGRQRGSLPVSADVCTDAITMKMKRGMPPAGLSSELIFGGWVLVRGSYGIK